MAAKATRRKTYTVASANKSLPLVRMIVNDIISLHRDLHERQARLSEIRRRYHRNEGPAGDPYREEVDTAEADLTGDRQRLDGYLAELEELGVKLLDADSGRIDFPATNSGRSIWLTWSPDDVEIRHWRALDDEPELQRALSELPLVKENTNEDLK